jgi:hypothetical protein
MECSPVSWRSTVNASAVKHAHRVAGLCAAFHPRKTPIASVTSIKG